MVGKKFRSPTKCRRKARRGGRQERKRNGDFAVTPPSTLLRRARLLSPSTPFSLCPVNFNATSTHPSASSASSDRVLVREPGDLLRTGGQSAPPHGQTIREKPLPLLCPGVCLKPSLTFQLHPTVRATLQPQGKPEHGSTAAQQHSISART